MPQELPSFDLVVATVDRAGPLERLFGSLERQTYRRFRVLLADQNNDRRLEPIAAAHPALDIVHLHSSRGLSHARNRALPDVTADVVAFPDDDCVYPDDLLERLAERFASDADLDGVTGKAESADGRSSASWRSEAAILGDDNLWNRAISYTVFLRRPLVERVGAFDERLGLGSREPWSSGEEIDYLIRAVRTGARIEYDPWLVVVHDLHVLRGEQLRALGRRDGASVGYLLRKHHYPARVVLRMLVRPVGGALRALVRRDVPQARFHAATLRGRLAGLRARTAK